MEYIFYEHLLTNVFSGHHFHIFGIISLFCICFLSLSSPSFSLTSQLQWVHMISISILSQSFNRPDRTGLLELIKKRLGACGCTGSMLVRRAESRPMRVCEWVSECISVSVIRLRKSSSLFLMPIWAMTLPDLNVHSQNKWAQMWLV